ncbi:MAG: hypothetical protein WEA24_04480 [Gemmatimonadota bacterium]
MPRPFSSGKLPAAVLRDLQVAAAVAREAVAQLHVERALELIRHAEGRVPDLRMLDIYMRLLDVSGPAGEILATRVLASLERPPGAATARAAAPPAADEEVQDDRSLLRLLRRQLRGRVHDDLRRAVVLHTGVVQTALLETHVRHANGFVKLVAERRTIHEACILYTEMVPVPPTLAAVLYMLVLDQIAAEERPTSWPAPVGAEGNGGGAHAGRTNGGAGNGAAQGGAQRKPRAAGPPSRAGHANHRARFPA